MGAGLVRGPGCDAPTLQAVSTRCALAGSVVAVLDALTQEPVVSQPSRLELAAVALITASLLLEAEPSDEGAVAQARRHVAAMDASAHRSSNAPPQVPRPAPTLQQRACGQAVAAAAGAPGPGLVGDGRLHCPRGWRGAAPGHRAADLGWPARRCVWVLRAPQLATLRLERLGPAAARPVRAQSCTFRGDIGSTGRRRQRRTQRLAPFMAASAFISVTSGFCVWCLARPAIHAGASGIVCGYVGLLLALTLRQRDVPLGSLLMVLGVVVCYGSVVLLSRPMAGGCPRGDCFNGRLSLYEACTSRTTSAEQHTFGFLSGLASAVILLPAAPANAKGNVAAKAAWQGAVGGLRQARVMPASWP
eukprot:CAMPEP_0179209746 /NCGR_PEP_ID=MMETSP0796-20121207/104608_1 /TAXON_ID=73915 /ORGANISM="Pyrodinium bahamense, Strain pbaha01" /LENGTH=360 /DNA_ID=CAMNT_0020914705 /DNA_START=54 /DNA_END=1134 /DNA_ORIENTATION=-